MQTPPVLPSLNAPASAIAPPARAQDVSSGDQQFTQMLLRQMAERDAAKASARAVEGPKPVPRRADSVTAPNKPITPQSNSAAASANTARNDADGASASVAASGATADGAQDGKATPKTDDTTASKSDPKAAAKDSPGGDASVAGGATATALDASAAIMALVANASASSTAKSAVAVDAAADQVSTDLSRVLSTERRTTEKLSLAAGGVATPTEAAVKDLAAKGAAAFEATLQGATQSKLDGSVDSTLLATAGAAQSGIDSAALRDTSVTLLPLQQAALMQTAPAGLHPGDVLAPHIAGPNWDQSLGQRMAWMVAGAEQTASLTLNPPDLGPMQVVLHVSNGQADASFFSAQPEVRQALEAAMPKLREMLGDAGVTLGQTNVSAGNPQAQNAFAQTGAGPGRRDNAADDSIAPIQSGTRQLSSGNGLVDTFA